MKKMKKMLGIISVTSLLMASLVPAISHAIPTNYYGQRLQTGSSYYSFTYSNGYEQGSSVTNTVMAQMSGSASSKRTKTGVGTVSVNSAEASGNALHGVGTGTSIQVSWTEN